MPDEAGSACAQGIPAGSEPLPGPLYGSVWMGVIGHPAGACTVVMEAGVCCAVGRWVLAGCEGVTALPQPLTRRVAASAMPSTETNRFIEAPPFQGYLICPLCYDAPGEPAITPSPPLSQQ